MVIAGSYRTAWRSNNLSARTDNRWPLAGDEVGAAAARLRRASYRNTIDWLQVQTDTQPATLSVIARPVTPCGNVVLVPRLNPPIYVLRIACYSTINTNFTPPPHEMMRHRS